MLTRYGGENTTDLRYGQRVPQGLRVRITGALDVARQEGRLGVEREYVKQVALALNLGSQNEITIMVGDAPMNAIISIFEIR